MKPSKWISPKISGICGLLSPLIAFGFISCSIFLHPWFNWSEYALSDLGALDTPYNFIYNIGMILTGILGLLFSCNLQKLINGRIGIVGAFFFNLGMISLVLVGAFSSGTTPHTSVSYGFFAFCAVGLVLLGVDQLLSPTWSWGALLLSLVLLALSSVGFLSTISSLGAAIPEAIGAITFSEFSILFGIRLLGEEK